MLSGVRRLGHAVPPIFVVAPLGLLSTSVMFDFIHLMGGGVGFGSVAYWMVLSGLTAGAAAAILGFVDWFMLPDGSREKKKALTHLIAYVVVLAAYAASAYVRRNDPTGPEIASTILATFGSAVALFGATIGAELISRNDARERSRHRVRGLAHIATER
jgi:uncharacterized membrane protein